MDLLAPREPILNPAKPARRMLFGIVRAFFLFSTKLMIFLSLQALFH